jgi:prolyl-tRNA synthetase
MRQSQLFTKTQKFAPKDETSKNAQLLIRGGFIFKEMAGVYSFLPLGWRVMNKIMQIIREEMNAIGCQEMFMASLQAKQNWERSGRWDDAVVDVWFKTQLKNGTDVGLAFTHEEDLTSIMKNYISSYKDLPLSAYHFQTKFRNEVRAKSGIMRSREFIMKDAYSFCASVEEHDAFYEQAKQAYIKVFDRLGIGADTFVTFASGGTFSKYSHEFQTICTAGEDTIYVNRDKKIALNEEVMTDTVLADLGVVRDELEQVTAAEVGNIFSLGTKFSDAFGLTFKGADEQEHPVIMGSYGIGPARCMGVIVEFFGADNAIRWPQAVSPFAIHLISLNQNAAADKIYDELTAAGVDVLYDERDLRPGEKFADADLIGCHTRITVGQRSLESGTVEITIGDGVAEAVSIDQICAYVAKIV